MLPSRCQSDALHCWRPNNKERTHTLTRCSHRALHWAQQKSQHVRRCAGKLQSVQLCPQLLHISSHANTKHVTIATGNALGYTCAFLTCQVYLSTTTRACASLSILRMQWSSSRASRQCSGEFFCASCARSSSRRFSQGRCSGTSCA